MRGTALFAWRRRYCKIPSFAEAFGKPDKWQARWPGALVSNISDAATKDSSLLFEMLAARTLELRTILRPAGPSPRNQSVSELWTLFNQTC